MKINLCAFILVSIILFGNSIRAQSQWFAPASTTDILNTVCFIDSLTGWVGGMLDDGKTGVIRKTTDGGTTWAQQTLPIADPIRKIVFVSSSTGYAACYHGRILKTVDGGQTWIEKVTGTTDNLQSIFFLNSQLGWACGGDTVLITKDGGETWMSRTVPGNSSHYDIAFGNEKEGTLAGGVGGFFTTTDGGETWKQAAVPSFTYYGIAYLSQKKEIAVGDNIELSRDGGLSWQQLKAPSGLWLNKVDFADSLIGWVVGPNGIFKSTDGGAQWTQQSNPSPSSMYADISTPDGIHAWTVAYHLILKITDKQTVSFSHSTLTASPASISMDGMSTSTITLQVKDADSLNITSSVGPVVFATTAGTLGSVVDHNDGTYTAVLTSPMIPVSAIVTASLGGTPFAATATVQLGPSLSLSTITAVPEYIRADGFSTSTITVQLKDGVGNNLTTSAGSLVLTTTTGSLGAVVDHNDGSYTSVLRSSATTGGMATVTASLNGTALDGSATVLFTNSIPVRPPLDTTALPRLSIGDKWFYQYVSMSERAFVVKEITDTTADGTRTVRVTKFSPTKKTVTTEKWSISPGAFRIDNKSVYIIPTGSDTVLNSGGRSNVQYLFNGQRLNAQAWKVFYYDHTSSSGEEYRAAPGVGLYLHMSYANWGSIPQSRDTLFLLGVQLNGTTYGEFNPYTIIGPPNPPVPISPRYEQPVVSFNVLFTWTASGYPTAFRIQVSRNASFSTLLLDDSMVTASSYSWKMPAVDGLYYWRVKAANAFGSSYWSSATFSFVGTGVPQQTSPADGTYGIQIKPTFTWTVADGALSYVLQVSTENTFVRNVQEQAGITGLAAAPFTLSENMKYFWRVAAVKGYGRGMWSSVWSFTTANPRVPAPVSPANGTTEIRNVPTFTWTAVTGASSYVLQISTESSFDIDVQEQANIKSLSATPFVLSKNTKYFWRVAAFFNSSGRGDFSSIASFTTGQSDNLVDSSMTSYSLGQNFPNPCNASTTILFTLPAASFARLEIWNALGAKVTTLVSEELPSGVHVRQFKADGYPSGVYYYRLQAGAYTETRRLVIVK